MPNPTRKPAPRPAKPALRPNKPYPDFPLSPHASGAWQKKIRGKVHYFGKWGRRVGGVLVRVPGDGWEEALAEYKAKADDLHAGRTPRAETGGVTVAGLSNHFLTAKQRQMDAVELSPRTFAEYKATTDRLVRLFGKTRLVSDLAADDFEALRSELAATFGPVSLGNQIQKARTVFKYGYEAGLIDAPVRFGPQFKKPSRKVMRVHRAAGGKRLFTADELRRVIDAAGVPLRAMILLGVNAGFGNSDCGRLPLAALDLDGGWVEFPRPKTGVDRRAALWPETVAALRAGGGGPPGAERPGRRGAGVCHQVRAAVGGRGHVRRRHARNWEAAAEARHPPDRVGFYALRHTFRTVADGAKDVNAVRTVMGHTDDSIDGNYTHGIADERLKAVTDHVRAWLYPPELPAAGYPRVPVQEPA